VKQALQQGFSSRSRWLLQILGLRTYPLFTKSYQLSRYLKVTFKNHCCKAVILMSSRGRMAFADFVFDKLWG